MIRFVPALTLLLITGSLAGCGGSDITLENISGTATFSGQPIVYGQIEFVPDTGKSHSGPAGTAEIVDGKFDTLQGGSGVVPGPHLVRITAYEARPAAASEDETVVSDAKPPIFTGYTMEMDVKAGELTVAVPDDAKGFNLYGGGKATKSRNEP